MVVVHADAQQRVSLSLSLSWWRWWTTYWICYLSVWCNYASHDDVLCLLSLSHQRGYNRPLPLFSSFHLSLSLHDRKKKKTQRVLVGTPYDYAERYTPKTHKKKELFWKWLQKFLFCYLHLEMMKNGLFVLYRSAHLPFFFFKFQLFFFSRPFFFFVSDSDNTVVNKKDCRV